MKFTEIKEKWKEYSHIKNKNDYISLYIHIPYCNKRCNYCMHSSKEIDNQEQVNNYLNELEKQFQTFSFIEEKVESIYIGGGTPSILNIDQLEKLFSFFKYFNINKNIDNMFSFEAHPESLTKEKIDFIHSTFINRISMGIQSFDKKVLDLENRFNPENTLEIVEILMKTFQDKKSRINIDLMYGLKSQTLESALNDFDILSKTNVSKITIYGNRQKRTPEQKILFKNKFAEYINILKNENYNKIFDAKEYRGGNYFIHKNFDGWFKKIYTTQPLLYNSCLGLGFWANSWIIPNKFTYSTLSDEYSNNIHYKNYNKLCNGHEDEIDFLRIDQQEKLWFNLPMIKVTC